MTFAAPDFDDHERVVFCTDHESGLQAIVAIHRLRHGRAVGGCRVRAYASDDAAVADVLRLSRAMTFKAALAGLPCGGAKAVIVGDPRTVKTPAALRAMGRAIESLGGMYVTAEDVGMTQADLRVMKEETPWVLGTEGEAAPFTALGVLHALRAAAEHRFGTADLGGLVVAVQGVGSVGRRLCALLREAGAALVVADVDAATASRVADACGAQTVAPDRIHAAGADVFAPCALGGVLNRRSVGELRAAIVVGAANNQLDTPADGIGLHERGIVYVPDYLANAGGLISGLHELQGDGGAVEAKVAEIGDTARLVLREADRRDIAPSEAADLIARARLEE